MRIYRTEICHSMGESIHTYMHTLLYTLNAIWGKVWRVRIKRDVPRMLVKHSPPRDYRVVTRSRFLGIVIAYLGDSGICMRFIDHGRPDANYSHDSLEHGRIFIYDCSPKSCHYLSCVPFWVNLMLFLFIVFLDKFFLYIKLYERNYLFIFRSEK